RDFNAAGMIRVDTSTLADTWALVGYDNSDNDGGTVMFASALTANGAVTLKNGPIPPNPLTPPLGPGQPYGILDPFFTSPPVGPPPASGFINTLTFLPSARHDFYDLLRDPDNPFLTPTS